MARFSWLVDGSIIGLYLLIVMIAGIMVRRYVGKVEHFLVAGREMNIHLGIASLAATEFGIVTCMYTAQNGFHFGFAGATPGLIEAGAMFAIGLTGFCIRPLRDAGVITIPELFEKKFGPTIRWASGVVIVLGGLLNMGVFLRTGGDFLVQVTGLNVRYLEITMTALLVMVTIYTILGGMLSVLITDYLQFIVMSVGLVALTILIVVKVGWGAIVRTVETNQGAGGFNPFINSEMGWPFVLFNFFLMATGVLTWQTSIARVLAAKDTKTGLKVYKGTALFFVCRFLIPGIWGIAALAMLPPQEVAGDTLHAMPLLLSKIVPSGMLGLMVAAMLAADMSTDSSYMLTWASVIYNDIMAPFRKKPWSEKKGLFWNRSLVGLIGVFLLIYGLWYPLKGDLWTYIGVTATIYLSSMSVLLIACCYWKKANSWGAGAAIISGALIPTAFLLAEQLPSTAGQAKKIGPYYSGIATYLLVGAAMVVGSLLKPKPKVFAAERGAPA